MRRFRRKKKSKKNKNHDRPIGEHIYNRVYGRKGSAEPNSVPAMRRGAPPHLRSAEQAVPDTLFEAVRPHSPDTANTGEMRRKAGSPKGTIGHRMQLGTKRPWRGRSVPRASGKALWRGRTPPKWPPRSCVALRRGRGRKIPTPVGWFGSASRQVNRPIGAVDGLQSLYECRIEDSHTFTPPTREGQRRKDAPPAPRASRLKTNRRGGPFTGPDSGRGRGGCQSRLSVARSTRPVRR